MVGGQGKEREVAKKRENAKAFATTADESLAAILKNLLFQFY